MPKQIWTRARELRDEVEKLSLDAREVGEKEVWEAFDRARKELDHPSLQSYDPKNLDPKNL